MKLSLAARVLLLLALINLVAFVAAGVVLERRSSAKSELQASQFVQRLESTILSAERPGVERILEWPSWSDVRDAYLIVDRFPPRIEADRIQLRGLAINPVGSVARGPRFDEQAVLRAMLAAYESGSPVEDVEDGVAVPFDALPGSWGACWFRRDGHVDVGLVVRNLLPWFLFSTLLLTAVSFVALRRLVLSPVETLARAARRVGAGDLATRVPEPGRDDELADLMRTFNAMTRTVQGFNERLRHEVEQATARAREATSVAMTQRRLAAMGELAAGIAHEINNPLGGLLNAVETLQRRELEPAKRAQYLELLRGGLERIRDTVGQLLRFTPRDACFAAVDLVEVGVDAMGLVAHRAQEEGVALELALPGGAVLRAGDAPPADGGVPTIQGARNELGQALLNLLVNSLDALAAPRPPGAPARRIRLSLSVARNGILLAVEDNGPGVPAEELDRVSDLFYTTKEVGKGTGLGLSLVHSIVDRHDGSVRIASEPGRGFRVELRLPLAGPGAAGGGPAPPPGPPTTPAEAGP